MFSLKHIIILTICIIYIVFMLVLLSKKKPKLDIVVKYLLFIGIFSETLKVCSYIVKNEAEYGGYLPKTDLPFHLCSIQIIFMIVLVLSKNENVKRVLYSFMLPTCLIGGIAAMLLPTSSSLNMPVITVQYFIYHASIVVFAIYLLISKEIEFNIKDYRNALLMLFAFFFISIYLNSWVNDYINNINFMYVINPPINGLPFLNKEHGWLIYIIHYALLSVFVVSICYIKPILKKLKRG